MTVIDDSYTVRGVNGNYLTCLQDGYVRIRLLGALDPTDDVWTTFQPFSNDWRATAFLHLLAWESLLEPVNIHYSADRIKTWEASVKDDNIYNFVPLHHEYMTDGQWYVVTLKPRIRRI